MPVYEFMCDCQYRWEDILHHADPIPTVCPDCNQEGKVKRLISLTSHGKVELTGNELKIKLKEDGRKLKAAASKDENLYANLVGPQNYENNLASKKKADENRPKIKFKKSEV
jgi:putative FmdB family regulatory protein